MNNINEAKIEQLRWICDTSDFEFDSTEELEIKNEILGQDKAIKALEMGLTIESPGYNIFVVGHQGTGRNTSVKYLLEEKKRSIKEIPDDIIYVYNFKSPDSPIAIKLKAGMGNKFKRDMDIFIDTMKTAIPNLYESENYKNRKNNIINDMRERSNQIIKKFEEEAKENGFALIQVQAGQYMRPDLIPLIDGNQVSWQDLDSKVKSGEITEEKYEELEKLYIKFSDKLSDVYKEIRKLEREMNEKLESLDKNIAKPIIRDWIDELGENFINNGISKYLKEVMNHLLDDIKRFIKFNNKKGDKEGFKQDDFLEYKVNVIVDNSELEHPPVIIENFPSYKNLFGYVDKIVEPNGRISTNFMMIKAGSLIQANGGFLVLNIMDVLQEPRVWQTLKRVLRYSSIEIQSIDPYNNMFAISSLKPQCIDINLKVIVIGNHMIYNILYGQDPDFKKIFKIMAEFDYEMDNTIENRIHYATFIRKLCENEKLMHFSKEGVARVVEYGLRLADKQNKLTTQFNDLADIVRESHYWAKDENNSIIKSNHVKKAIDEKIKRINLTEEKIKQSIIEKDILITIEGEIIGQVNGLAVYNLGNASFGKPTRITAKTSVGKLGIINIEREAMMSGPIHNKGILIISGFLKNKFAQDKPLAIDASIAFEQSYGGVDGDSASSTEIYAILSSLSELPIKQYIAVTGSVNQNGEIQPIGGVNQKIEGFFDICKSNGLTGKQGVIIPIQNVDNLMLKDEILHEVKNDNFHIYPIKTIEEGITLLTGVNCGERTSEGKFPSGTVYFLVEEKLKTFANKFKEYGIG